MKKLEECPCCESREIKLYFKNLYDKSYFVKGNSNMFKCSDCGLEFINPLLNEEEEAKYYPEQEYYSFKNKNKLPIIYHRISAYYYSGKNKILNFFLLPFKGLFYTYYIDKGKKVLEIGCGDGMKLEIYRNYGMKTNGIEPYGGKLSEKEKELGILRKSVKNARYFENSFDYVILKDVLEHIPEQKIVLKKCYKWMKKNGKLIITTQNTSSLWCKVFRENWFGYDVPRHLYNYNPENISFFLKKLGFKIEKIRVYDSPFMISGSLEHRYIKKTKEKRRTFRLSNVSKTLFTPLSLVVTYLKKGSLMEIICSK